MNTAVITIKTDTETKSKAQKVAEQIGVSLNVVMERYLKHFIKTQRVDKIEKPNEYLIKSLKESDADKKAGRITSFASGKDALDYLDEEIAHDKQTKRSAD